ncbi:MAG: tyrosine-type recombinase/integrase [Alphaproteobacteria bacterium]|nr:tyrosine-type recombinase/integrase [Alphaproteobacteria bacterium]
MDKYTCVLHSEMESFLNYYRSLGHDVRGYVTIFNQLDLVLRELNVAEKVITNYVAVQFSKSFSVRPYCFHNYISHYNVFARYLKRLGVDACELELPLLKSDYTPYIYSDEEWCRIIEAADNLVIPRCPLYSIQMPLLIRIIYGCGTRINETLSLKVSDVDLISGVLYLKRTKNKRHRIVPMDNTLTEIFRKYVLVRGLKADDYVFYSQRKRDHWGVYSVDNCFEHILKNAGISFVRENHNDRGPCVHCFRHTFVLNSLKKSEKNGRDFSETVPFLSTYLGHSSIRETDKYLRFSYELYEDAVDLVESYTANLFPEVNSND